VLEKKSRHFKLKKLYVLFRLATLESDSRFWVIPVLDLTAQNFLFIEWVISLREGVKVVAMHRAEASARGHQMAINK